jgi:anti-sigma B factor antagonist
MGITVREEANVRILELAGEFALGGGGLAHPLDLRGNRLQDLSATLHGLLEQGCQRIVLDLGKVPFLDSAGLGELVACQKRTRQKGGDVRLLRPTRRVRDLFELTELTRVFLIFEDEREALASFRD